MNRSTRLVLIALLAIGTPVEPSGFEHISLSKQQIKDLGISTITPQPASEIPVAQASARITIPPTQEHVVSAPYAGLINRVDAALGEQVSKGQLLAQISSPELLNLQRDLLNDSSELQLATAKMRRDRTLLKEGVISQRRWQETKSQYNKYATLVKEAKQMLSIAGLRQTDIRQLLRSRRLSSTLKITAPASGVILEKNSIAGQRVDALTPLFRLANLDTLWVDISMPQERVPTINLDDAVMIEGSTIQARVTLIGQSVDPDDQSVLVRAVIKQQAGSVRPGQKVTVRLFKPTLRPLVSLPVSAVVRAAEQTYVFVPVEGGFDVRPVTIAGREGQSITISEGLEPGQSVVVEGVAVLKGSWMGIGGE